jgi:hypothetical protein
MMKTLQHNWHGFNHRPRKPIIRPPARMTLDVPASTMGEILVVLVIPIPGAPVLAAPVPAVPALVAVARHNQKAMTSE